MNGEDSLSPQITSKRRKGTDFSSSTAVEMKDEGKICLTSITPRSGYSTKTKSNLSKTPGSWSYLARKRSQVIGGAQKSKIGALCGWLPVSSTGSFSALNTSQAVANNESLADVVALQNQKRLLKEEEDTTDEQEEEDTSCFREAFEPDHQFQAEIAKNTVELEEDLSLFQQQDQACNLKEIEIRTTLALLQTQIKELVDKSSGSTHYGTMLTKLPDEKANELRRLSKEIELLVNKVEVALQDGQESLKYVSDGIMNSKPLEHCVDIKMKEHSCDQNLLVCQNIMNDGNNKVATSLQDEETESVLERLSRVQVETAKFCIEKDKLQLSEKESKRFCESILSQMLVLQNAMDCFEDEFKSRIDALERKLQVLVGTMQHIGNSWLEQKRLLEAKLGSATAILTQATENLEPDFAKAVEFVLDEMYEKIESIKSCLKDVTVERDDLCRKMLDYQRQLEMARTNAEENKQL